MSMLFIAISLAIAISGTATLVVLILAGSRSTTGARLSELRSPDSEPPGFSFRDAISWLSRPLAPFRDRLRSGDEDLTYRLGLAGYRNPEDVDAFLTLKLLSPVVGVLIATFAGHNFVTFALVLGGAAYFLPDLLLMRAINRRNTKLGFAVPDAMDLMVICMEAGLGMDQAVLRIASETKKVHPGLSEELLMISREQHAGKPRIEAWRAMADRIDVDSIRQFVGMLTQTERLGTPIATALSQFADALRTTRLMRAEERAAKTSIKLIFPLVLFIFPALFVVLLGPAMIAIMQGLDQTAR